MIYDIIKENRVRRLVDIAKRKTKLDLTKPAHLHLPSSNLQQAKVYITYKQYYMILNQYRNKNQPLNN